MPITAFEGLLDKSVVSRGDPLSLLRGCTNKAVKAYDLLFRWTSFYHWIIIPSLLLKFDNYLSLSLSLIPKSSATSHI